MTSKKSAKDEALSFKIPLPLPSINAFYTCPHWTLRSKLQKEWKNIVAAHLKAHLAYNHIQVQPGKPLYNCPVKITITNYAKKPVDAANLYTKCLDALEGIVIVNDGYKCVVEVSCITRKVKGEEYCDITITPIKIAKIKGAKS